MVALSFFVILLATAFSGLANFFVQFLLARTLGPGQFGTFSSSIAMVTLFSQLAAFGVGAWWFRVFGEEGYAAQRWIKPSLQFSGVSTLFGVTLILVWATFGPHDSPTAQLIKILSSVLLAQVIIDLVSARFQLEEKHTHLAAWQLISHPFRLIGLLLLILYFPLLTPLYVAYLYLGISVLIILIGAFFLAGLHNATLRLSGHQELSQLAIAKDHAKKPSLKDVFIRTSPFGLGGFFFLVYYQTDLILLRYLINEEASGFYGASVVFMAAAYLLPSVLYQKFLSPRIHRWAYDGSNRLEVFIRQSGIEFFTVGILVMFIFWYGAEYFISVLLGDDYLPSVPLLMLMSLAIPFRYLASHLGAVLYTRDFIWTSVKISCITAFLNVFLNLLLIPYLGAIGAAIATVLSYVSLAGLFVIATLKRFKVHGLGKRS